MHKYELVCVIDAGLPTTEIKTVQTNVENTLGKGTILATDQIGLLPLAYPLNGQDQGFFVSYHLHLDPTAIDAIKGSLRLEKGLAKFVFYKMHDNEQFLKFGDLQKKFDESWPKDLKKEKAEEEKRNAQKIADEKAAGEAVAQEATS